MQIWLNTNRFATDPYYSNGTIVHFPVATQDPLEMSHYLDTMVKQIHTAGYRYKKIGILFLDLCDQTGIQPDLFDTVPRERNQRLGEAVDRVNKYYGRMTVYTAACGVSRPWEMQRHLLSPVMPNWKQLARVQAK